MRQLSRVLFAALLVIGPAATLAHAVTVADLINLRANGVSDDILVALIQTDGTVFKLSADEIIDLKKRGLSDRVVLAMLLNGRRVPMNTSTPAAVVNESAATKPAADAATTDDTQPAQRVESEQKPPVVNVTQTVTQTVEQPQAPYATSSYYPGFYTAPFLAFPAFPATYVPTRPVQDSRPIQREYWGFNGARRPDSWAPSRDRAPDPPPEPSRRVPGSLKK